jgi:hypothetical protein
MGGLQSRKIEFAKNLYSAFILLESSTKLLGIAINKIVTICEAAIQYELLTNRACRIEGGSGILSPAKLDSAATTLN